MGKQLCRSLFINKIAGLLKKTPTQVFSVNFAKFSRTSFFKKTPAVAASKVMVKDVSNVNLICDDFLIFFKGDRNSKFCFIGKKSRSSRPEVCCKKSVLRNFAKFTGKHRC